MDDKVEMVLLREHTVGRVVHPGGARVRVTVSQARRMEERGIALKPGKLVRPKEPVQPVAMPVAAESESPAPFFRSKRKKTDE